MIPGRLRFQYVSGYFLLISLTLGERKEGEFIFYFRLNLKTDWLNPFNT